MICAADGGVIDDLIVYRLEDQDFLVVANASNAGVVASGLRERAGGPTCGPHQRVRADRHPGPGGGGDPAR